MTLSPRLKKLLERTDLILFLAALIAVIIFRKNMVVLFILILLVLVVVHEFGHFIAAKWVGMRVDEFAFGFPPRLFAKKKGETTYAINAIPIGGYVSIWGENGEPDDAAKHHPRAFGNRPKWQQLVVLLAGVFMNMVLAFVIFTGLSYGKIQMSVSDPVYGSRVKDPFLMVAQASPNSPAYLAGITEGSVITSMVSGGQKAPLPDAEKTVEFIAKHQNDSFDIRFTKPNGTESETVVAAVYGIVPDKKALGLNLDTQGTITTSLREALSLGADHTWYITTLTIDGFKDLLASIGKKNVLDSLAGPIGLVQVVGERSAYGLEAVLTLVAILSINLAIFNALPVPALDGGRVVVVLLEAISRKRIPFKYYSWANIAGFSGLMLLLLVVTVHDVMRIFA